MSGANEDSEMQNLHDALNEFLSEQVLNAPRGRTRTHELYDAFSTWATTRSAPWASWAEISRKLQDLGVPKGKYNGRMVFRGVILRDDPQADKLAHGPYTPRHPKPRPPVRQEREAWTPGPADWNALRGDLAGLRADLATLTAAVQMVREAKGAGRRAPTVQLSFAGLEPAPAGQEK